MAELVTLEQIAELVNTDLNALSNELYTSGLISRPIEFSVVAHVQNYFDDKIYYNEEEDTYGVTPGLLKRTGGAFSPSQNYKSYRDVTRLNFKTYYNDYSDIDYILNEYASRYSGLIQKSANWTYQASYERPYFGVKYEDEGEYRLDYFLDVAYSFIFKGFMSDDITITIGDDLIEAEEVNVLTYQASIEKDGPTNDYKSNAGHVENYFTKGTRGQNMKMVHVDSPIINKIFTDIKSGNFLDNVYTIDYTLGDTGYNDSTDVMISTGQISFEENGFQVIDATFVDAKELS